MGKYKSVQEIDQQYQAQIEAAADGSADRFRLMAEREQAKTAFYQERESVQALQTARVQATTQFPKAKAELVSGDTPEAILASAKALHDFAEEQAAAAIAAKSQELEAAARGRAYGGGGNSGGSTVGIPAQGGGPAVQLVERVQNGLRTGGLIQEQDANDMAEAVGHLLFRTEIDGKVPDDWEGTVHVGGSR